MSVSDDTHMRHATHQDTLITVAFIRANRGPGFEYLSSSLYNIVT